jgi:hypothetical protein
MSGGSNGYLKKKIMADKNNYSWILSMTGCRVRSKAIQGF